VLELAEQIVQFGNVTALSDGATGAALARAAINGAGYNIRINAKDLPPNLANMYISELTVIEQHTAEIESRIHTALHAHGI
jgi:formiminotetrahydrofolate cyclodeaminase